MGQNGLLNFVVDISWLGHACFRLRGRDVTILTDPFEGDDWGYAPLSTSADVVTVSNPHPHHAGLSGVSGAQRVLRGPGEYEIGGALIWGVRTPRRAEENGRPQGAPARPRASVRGRPRRRPGRAA